MAATMALTQASATLTVPTTLVMTPSKILASTMGTCLSAAAWKTRWGRNFANILSRRPRSRTSASTAWRLKSGLRPAVSRSMAYRLASEWSRRTSSDGPKSQIWRTSSLPMLPPAPVTRTRRPSMRARMAPRSRAVCGRPSRSSSAMGVISTLSLTPLLRSVSLGSRASIIPNPSASSSRARTRAPSMFSLVRIRRWGRSPSAASRSTMEARCPVVPITSTPWMWWPTRDGRSATIPNTR